MRSQTAIVMQVIKTPHCR